MTRELDSAELGAKYGSRHSMAVESCYTKVSIVERVSTVDLHYVLADLRALFHAGVKP